MIKPDSEPSLQDIQVTGDAEFDARQKRRQEYPVLPFIFTFLDMLTPPKNRRSHFQTRKERRPPGATKQRQSTSRSNLSRRDCIIARS